MRFANEIDKNKKWKEALNQNIIHFVFYFIWKKKKNEAISVVRSVFIVDQQGNMLYI